MEECLLDNDTPVIRAEAFGVPEELWEAFYAYHAEFLTDHGTSISTSGPFYNDEDVNEGVRKKYWYFYWPIVKLLEKNTTIYSSGLKLNHIMRTLLQYWLLLIIGTVKVNLLFQWLFYWNMLRPGAYCLTNQMTQVTYLLIFQTCITIWIKCVSKPSASLRSQIHKVEPS